MNDHVITRFREAAKKYAKRPATRIRERDAWRVQTYEEFASRVDQVAQGLIDAGVEAGDRVAQRE